ncbi:MAG TPA: hypothetical protein VEJ18_20535 [Planctomycetota bacterium]|nr:hypothetical protein [Planctomycetota bacterium]
MLAALMAALALQADPAPVKWLTDFKAAQAQAQRLGRPLVIDAGRKA